MGLLYIVATPIGNLEDITLRALRILREVSVIAAEDTRVTRGLLSHYDIHTRMISHHNANEKLVTKKILDILESEDVAIVSDAGTPLINDPGFIIVKAAIEAGIRVVPIPGPSSPITALSVSGLPVDEFTYLGYLPHKQGDRLSMLRNKSELSSTLIIFSTPHRVLDDLQDILSVFGNRSIAVCRELTKMHEEVFRGNVQNALDHIQEHPPLGEFVLIIAGNATSTDWDDEQIDSAITSGLAENIKSTTLATIISRDSGVAKKEIYRRIEDRKKRE